MRFGQASRITNHESRQVVWTRLRILAFCFCIGQACPTAATQASDSVNAEFDQLINKIWQYEVSQSPQLQLTYNGAKPVDSLFPPVLDSELDAREQQYNQFLKQLTPWNDKTLDRSRQLTLAVQKYRLRWKLNQRELMLHLTPMNSEYGFYAEVANQIQQLNIETTDDKALYMQSLHDLPLLFERKIQLMKLGLELGVTQPTIAMRGSESTVLSYISSRPDTSMFYQPVNRSTFAFSDDELKRVKRAILEIEDSYHQLATFLVDEYFPKANPKLGLSDQIDGPYRYQKLIEHYTTLSLTAEDIHAIGLAEVRRIRKEMEEIVKRVNFNGNLKDFIHHLRTHPQFYFTEPDDLVIYASYLAKKMDARLPALFHHLPRIPYGVEAVPASIAPKYTTGRYIHPANDRSAGYYWVNTYKLDKRPKYALPALTLHEAVPGHHLQISLAKEMQGLPEVRRQTYISAFGEGWGLYAEYLGIEAGMYTDPYDDFGRLSYEMWRAARLVVDTGIHAYGWTREQAIQFMTDNTALSEHNIATEVDRYITWPGQALAYKLGEIEIRRLRRKAEIRLGERFDLREFHHQVLKHGSIPLRELKTNLEKYINKADMVTR